MTRAQFIEKLSLNQHIAAVARHKDKVEAMTEEQFQVHYANLPGQRKPIAVQQTVARMVSEVFTTFS